MAKEDEEKDGTLTGEIKDISLDYQQNKIAAEISEEKKEEMEKTRKELEQMKEKILKK